MLCFKERWDFFQVRGIKFSGGVDSENCAGSSPGRYHPTLRASPREAFSANDMSQFPRPMEVAPAYRVPSRCPIAPGCA